MSHEKTGSVSPSSLCTAAHLDGHFDCVDWALVDSVPQSAGGAVICYERAALNAQLPHDGASGEMP